MAENKNIVSIDAFLRKNVASTETQEVKFDRFGAPFMIQSVSEAKADALRKRATTKVKQNGAWTTSTNTNLFVDLLVTEAIVAPDLNNAQLQSDWGTPGKPIDTLKAMLLVGEYAELAKQVQSLSGFETEDLEETADEVKN